jgi:hypothetical protein
VADRVERAHVDRTLPTPPPPPGDERAVEGALRVAEHQVGEPDAEQGQREEERDERVDAIDRGQHRERDERRQQPPDPRGRIGPEHDAVGKRRRRFETASDRRTGGEEGGHTGA